MVTTEKLEIIKKAAIKPNHKTEVHSNTNSAREVRARAEKYLLARGRDLGEKRRKPRSFKDREIIKRILL